MKGVSGGMLAMSNDNIRNVAHVADWSLFLALIFYFDVSFLIALPVSLGLGWGIQKVFATSESCVDRPEP